MLARYGVGKDWADVTALVRTRVKPSQLKMTIPFRGDALRRMGLPDPAPNKNKLFVVVYSYPGTGRIGLAIAEADEELDLPPTKK